MIHHDTEEEDKKHYDWKTNVQNIVLCVVVYIFKIMLYWNKILFHYSHGSWFPKIAFKSFTDHNAQSMAQKPIFILLSPWKEILQKEVYQIKFNTGMN